MAAFSVVDVPVETAEKPLGAKLPLEPDVRSNARPFDGRVYVMVIDDEHTSFSRSGRVKRAARQFIEQRLADNDLMAVVHTAGATESSQEFTSNKRLLLAAVDRTMGRKLRSATLNKTDDYYRMRGTRSSGDLPRDPEDAERASKARSTLDTLRQVAEWFSSVRGRRKSILFVSEGIDYDITNVFSNSGASTIMDETRRVIAAAARSNVSIYSIDPRGLTNLGDEDITVGSYPDDPSLGLGPGSLMGELRLSQDSLRVLSENTGGFAAVNRNDYAGAYQRIVEENSSYYMLAYYPPTDRRDGRFHRIEVKVTRPGLHVNARKGYTAPKGRAPTPAPEAEEGRVSAELRDVLGSPLPVSGLTLAVFAAPFQGAGGQASVLLGTEMRGRDLKLDASDKVELSYLAIDAQGKVRGAKTEGLVLNLKPETRARVEQTGLRLLSRIDLPAGRYQLRVAARDAAAGTVGSVVYDLQVPDFTKGPLVVSGLVLTAARAAVIPTARPDETLAGVLPAPPAALRLFGPDDELVVYAEIYDNQGGTPHTVDLTTSVVSDDGQVVFKSTEERPSSELTGRRGGYDLLKRIPLKGVAPGRYTLKVEAQARRDQIASTREVPFDVRAAADAR